MKKVIEELASKFQCSTNYSGSIRIMYIAGEKNKEFIAHVRTLYPKLAFVLKVSEEVISPIETWEEAAKEHDSKSSGRMRIYSGSGVDTELAESITEKAYETVFGNYEPHEEFEGKEEQEKELSTIQKKEKLRAEVDTYLLSHGIDKSKKGFWAEIAKQFEGATGDYIRKRHSALKEKGLIN